MHGVEEVEGRSASLGVLLGGLTLPKGPAWSVEVVMALFAGWTLNLSVLLQTRSPVGTRDLLDAYTQTQTRVQLARGTLDGNNETQTQIQLARGIFDATTHYCSALGYLHDWLQ